MSHYINLKEKEGLFFKQKKLSLIGSFCAKIKFTVNKKNNIKILIIVNFCTLKKVQLK